MDGKIHPEHGGWQGWVHVKELLYDFILHVRSYGGRSSETRLSYFLKKVLPTCRKRRVNTKKELPDLSGNRRLIDRPYIYEFPTLEECRSHFDEQYGGPWDWPEIDEVELEEDVV